MADTTLMPQPGPAGAPQSKRVDATSVAQFLLLGSSFAGGGAVVYSLISLVREQPDRAFRLLQTWGPWFFLALFSIWVAYKLVLPLVTAAADAFGRISTSMEKQAESMGQLASATQSLADKDDRQVQEMQTLTAFTAQRSEKTYAMMQAFHEDNQLILKQQAQTMKEQGDSLRQQGDALKLQGDALSSLGAAVKRIEDKVDLRAAEASKS